MNVLIVDDNPATRVLITACFKKINPLTKLYVAGDDKTAIALARDNEFSFGTIDFNLGEQSKMRGLCLIDELKNLQPKTEFVLLTGSTEPSIFSRALEKGIEVVKKPVQIAKLRLFINN